MHKCLWPECDKLIPLSQWGCRSHWYRLPNNIRAWIGRTYRGGVLRGDHPSRHWLEAHHAALEWIAQQEVENRQ
jgi:hypothetical protein